MKPSIRIYILALTFVIALFTNTSFVIAQENQVENTNNKIITFLETSQELRDYSKNSFTSSFSGDFCLIPEDIQIELRQNFPQYEFYIAKMNVLIDPPASKHDLILITEKRTAEVKSFVWGDYWVIRPSGSFSNILKGFQAKSKEDAINQVKSFAKLLVSASKDNIGIVGNARIKKGKLSVELIRGAGVFAILEVEINKNLQFDRLTITEPDGKKLKYFV